MNALLALSLLVQLSAGQSDPDFAVQRDSVRAAYSMGTVHDRLAAVEAMTSFRTEESTRFLVALIPTQLRLVDALVAAREKMRSGRDPDLRGKNPGPYLLVLKEKLDLEYKILETIERSFMLLTDQKAVAYLARTVLPRGKEWKSREIAARVLGEIRDRQHIPSLVAVLRDRDARIRTAVLMSLGEMRGEEAIADIHKSLGDKDWIVRSAAIEALGKIRDPRSFEMLLARMQEEEGLLAEACAEALANITGVELGRAVDAWVSWWAENGEKLLRGETPEQPGKVEKPRSDEDGRYYHAIPVKSRRSIFILDVSESMSYSAREYQEKPKPGEQSRLTLAKRELLRVIEKYERKGSFGLIAFNTVVKVWRPRLVPAKKQMKDDAAEWVEGLKPTGTTNIYAALETAFDMAGMGLVDRYYPPSADTIFLLSDGAPTNQDLSDDDIERILRAVREWNRLKRVKIHTVGLKGHSVEFMSRLAEENGGIYMSRSDD